MFAIRIHGRGGQGAVTAAQILATAAATGGRHAQAFPTVGSERTGAPVAAFCRIEGRPIRHRSTPAAPPTSSVSRSETGSTEGHP